MGRTRVGKRSLVIVAVVVSMLTETASARGIGESQIDWLLDTFGAMVGVEDTSGIEVRIEKGAGGDLATMSNDGTVLTIYPDQFEVTFPELSDPASGLDTLYGEGLLTGTVLHELLHKCKGDQDDGYGFSCSHFFIDYNISQLLCELACDYQTLANDAELSGDMETFTNYTMRRFGICREYHRLRDKWAGEEASAKAAQCYEDNVEDMEQFVPNCNTQMPPPPDPPSGSQTSTYQNGPIGDCPCCQDADV